MLHPALKVAVVLGTVFPLLFALYHFGVISLDVKRSRLFIGSMGGNRARFQGCTGHTRRRLRFREAQSVSFALEASLTSGTVTVEILDGSRPLLLLNVQHPCGTLDVPAGARYTQVIRFDNASGEYTIKKA